MLNLAAALLPVGLVLVHGTIPAGSRIEFQAKGSRQRIAAEADAKGAYSLKLKPALYTITLTGNGERLSGRAWIARYTELNGRTNRRDYDVYASWRFLDKVHSGRPVHVRIFAKLGAGGDTKVKLRQLTPTGEEMSEVAGEFDTRPDGRVRFHIRESELLPERVAFLILNYQPTDHFPIGSAQFTKLEFGADGQLHAVYPAIYEISIPCSLP